MKKNKLLRRISVGVTALALVATSAVAVSFARYQTTVTETQTIEVAKWNFTANEKSDDTFTFVLKPDKKTEVAEGKIAPGIGGSFDLILANDSEVDAAYSVELVVANKPANLSFTVSDGTLTDGNSDGTYDLLTGTLAQKADTTQSKTLTFNWTWAYNADAAESDQATIATGDFNMSVTLNVKGWQAKPETPRT